jgi:hypothetical protein
MKILEASKFKRPYVVAHLAHPLGPPLCPGCRKLYDHVDVNVGLSIGSNAFFITQSCSMSTGY